MHAWIFGHISKFLRRRVGQFLGVFEGEKNFEGQKLTLKERAANDLHFSQKLLKQTIF